MDAHSILEQLMADRNLAWQALTDYWLSDGRWSSFMLSRGFKEFDTGAVGLGAKRSGDVAFVFDVFCRLCRLPVHNRQYAHIEKYLKESIVG